MAGQEDSRGKKEKKEEKNVSQLSFQQYKKIEKNKMKYSPEALALQILHTYKEEKQRNKKKRK